MPPRTALVIRENQSFQVDASIAASLGGWIIKHHYRATHGAHHTQKYIPEVMNNALIFMRQVDAIILCQEELTSNQLMEIFAEIRKEHPRMPILLIRRNTGRGKSLRWASELPPSGVIDFTTRTRVLVEALNKLSKEAVAHQNA